MKRGLIAGFIVLGIIILLIISLWLSFGEDRYHIEGYLIDGETQEPISDVNLSTSMMETPNNIISSIFLLNILGDWIRFYHNSSITNDEGYFKSSFPHGTHPWLVKKKISVRIFDDREVLLDYKRKRFGSFEINSNVTLILERVDELNDSFNETQCSDNHYCWNVYSNKCYLDCSDSLEDIPDLNPDKSCENDFDCKKICPYGCYNEGQEYDESLNWLGGVANCEESALSCVCLEGTCQLAG